MPPANVLRIALHPDGILPRVLNPGQWRAELLGRLRRQVAASADPDLDGLLDEVRGYPCPPGSDRPHGGGGIPLDVTVSVLAIESFYPADTATGDYLRCLAAAGGRIGDGAATATT